MQNMTKMYGMIGVMELFPIFTHTLGVYFYLLYSTLIVPEPGNICHCLPFLSTFTFYPFFFLFCSRPHCVMTTSGKDSTLFSLRRTLFQSLVMGQQLLITLISVLSVPDPVSTGSYGTHFT